MRCPGAGVWIPCKGSEQEFARICPWPPCPVSYSQYKGRGLAGRGSPRRRAKSSPHAGVRVTAALRL